jgi:hypothetical protein
MDTYNAFVIEVGENRFLCLAVKEKEFRISLTEDNPNAVKNVFNDLIVLLKQGLFKFKMEKVGTDLFSQVSKEYIVQLNKDLSDVYEELNHYKLLN